MNNKVKHSSQSYRLRTISGFNANSRAQTTLLLLRVEKQERFVLTTTTVRRIKVTVFVVGMHHIENSRKRTEEKNSQPRTDEWKYVGVE